MLRLLVQIHSILEIKNHAMTEIQLVALPLELVIAEHCGNVGVP